MSGASKKSVQNFNWTKMKYPSKKNEFFIDASCYFEECRRLAVAYKEKVGWSELRINKKYCSIAGYGEGQIIHFDDDPDLFLEKLKQLHKDYP